MNGVKKAQVPHQHLDEKMNYVKKREVFDLPHGRSRDEESCSSIHCWCWLTEFERSPHLVFIGGMKEMDGDGWRWMEMDGDGWRWIRGE